MKPYNTIEKYKRSEYLREYSEIISVYESQMKPLKNVFLVAFIAVSTLISTLIFLGVLDNIPIFLFVRYGVKDTVRVFAELSYFIPGIYFIRLRQVVRHKKRRLRNLEEKKMQAFSAGIYDANS